MIDEAEICMTGPNGEPSNGIFASKNKILQNLGVLLYSTSAVTTNGRNSRAIAIAYAKTEEGETVARIFADKCEGKLLSVYGGVNVTFARFPPKNPRSKKSKADTVRAFVKAHVLKNQENCSKHYRYHTITDVTSKAYDHNLIDRISATCNHVVGIIPRLMEGEPSEGELYRYRITIFVHKIGTTSVKDAKYFKRILLTNFPELFPASTSEDFVKVSGKKSSSNPKSTTTATTSNDANWAQLMDQGFKDLQPSLSEVFLIIWGKGGRASVGWTHSWYGPGGAKERTHRVSGAVFRKLKKKAEIFDVLSKTYGIMDEKDLVIFHRNVPHTETNLSPTWPVCFNGMPHRFGAVAHTWVEYDDDPTLAARIEATIHYTGTDDGVIIPIAIS